MRTAELFYSPSLTKLQSQSYLSSLPSLLTKNPIFRKKRSTTVRAVLDPSHNHNRTPARAVGKSLEPPWLVLPPPPPENPFAGQQPPLPRTDRNGVPFSLRLVQINKRLEVPPSPLSLDSSSAADGPVSKAVAALLIMIEELQKPVVENDEGGMVIDRGFRDRRDCFVWLFRRVFSNSPNLVPRVLLLLANFVAASTEDFVVTRPVVPKSNHAVSEAKPQEEGTHGEASSPVVSVASTSHTSADQTVVGNFTCWFDIGIREGVLEFTKTEKETSEDRRRRAYERAIVGGEANSLILCNYAQFLYQVAHDHDRAEQYFQWAATIEPKDAEAVSKYALFLWEVRGDLSRAEELLLEAIDIDPGSFYHSNYAWFLWKTGAEDTCFPLSTPSSR